MGRVANESPVPPPVRPDTGRLARPKSDRHDRPTPLAARAAAADAYRRALALDPHFAPHADVALEVLGELGRGGMGVVYRVRDRRLGREAALKLMIEAPDHPDVLQRFRREAEVTARLDHPSIPPVYEAGTDTRGRHYMLMRVIEGESLAQRVAAHHEGREDAPVSRELLEALVKAGEAVAHAHGRGVLHRDLKPANIMLGRFGEVMVMDWGLARRLDRDAAEDDAPLARSGTHITIPTASGSECDGVGLTQAGTVLGTPGYMAPEQTLGGALDERTDVFALGAILVEVLTGRSPIEGASPVQKLQRTARGKLVGVHDRRPDLPAELHDLAAAALARDPARRTRDAAAFVADLRAYLAGAEVSVHRYSARERALLAARRHPTRVVAGAAAAVVAAVIGLAATVGARASQPPEPPAPIAAAETPPAALPAAEAIAMESAAALVASRRAGGHALTAAQLERAGHERQRDGDLQGAVEAFSRAIRLDPTRAMTYVHRGDARQELGDLDGALLDYAHAIVLDAACATAYANRAAARRATGDVRGALQDVDRALTLDPNSVTNLVNRGLVRQELGDLDGAIADHSRALELDPARVDAWSHRGLARHAMGDLAGALADHDRAVALAPDDALVHVWRAHTRFAAGDLQGAHADADRALELAPELASAWNVRGVVRLNQGDETAALADLERAHALDPGSALVLHNRGLARHALGDLRGAIVDQGRAIDLEPALAAAWGARACAREDLGELEPALQDLDHALRLDAGRVDALHCRGRLRATLGDLPGARQDLARLEQLAPDSPEAIDLRAELARRR